MFLITTQSTAPFCRHLRDLYHIWNPDRFMWRRSL